jgi:choline dehydrogenase-like flavoprotein
VIAKLAEHGGDLALSADVCVIGSGGGGAVAAAVLAEAGRSVVVLEQGPFWTNADLTQREDQMLPRLFEEAGMRQTQDGGHVILQGRAVGGSTVHNLCYAFRTPEPILRLWREESGLASLTPEALAPSFERVERSLRVKPIREDELNSLNRRLRAGAERLGWSGLVARHNREGCVQSGYCILGCSYGAKQSMLVTYVPRADAAGARIYAGARAERIEAEGGRVRRVLGHAVDEGGAPGGAIEVRARVVVLAAGAVASPDLLRRSGLGDPEQVGRHLHLHPSVMAAGVFDEPIHAYRGIPQSYYVDEFIDLERDPHTGFVLMPISAFPVLTAANLPGFGRDHFALMREYAKIGGVLALLHDGSEGSVEPGDSLARPRIRYALDARDRAQLTQGLRRCVELLFASGARRVVVPYAPDPLVLERGEPLGELDRREVREGTIPLASTHPQSTCRMGADPRTSVVDAFGHCHAVRGLFVADMSVFPTSLGAPPQITTAALADRTAHAILARWDELAAA